MSNLNEWIPQRADPYVLHHTDGLYYCMGLMTADADADLLDPQSWTKSRHPVLTTNETVGLYGPGHNSFTRDAEGDIMVFHARTYEKIEGDPLDDPNRHAWHDARPVGRRHARL